ncbi:MAG: iron(III) transport system ATP-binding protein [Frankiaceae bacterium]|nr:iron(III) transport system ATP-binding protein [Frankiaceae bacterium]
MTVTLTKPEVVPATGHAVLVSSAVKRYGAATALAGVDLAIDPGSFLVLLGPSGSGKSTLARLLAGIERLDGGEIRFGETVVATGRRQLPPERRELAMVFQDYALWPHMTVLGNVSYALRRRRLDRSAHWESAFDALDRVGLRALADRYPHELSGGEQQRVALARAVVARPKLLIFDEPLSNLDADLRERLRVEIATLSRESGATSVYITHDQSEAFALADRIGVLDKGRLVQLGTAEDVYHRPANAFVARFTGLAAELTGTVASVRDGKATVELGGARVRTLPGGGVKAGDRVQVLVRPAATRFAAPTDAGADGVIAGTVIDLAYRGRGYEHVVSCRSGVIAAVFDAHARPRGSAVHVALDPDRCVAHQSDEAMRTGS